MIKIAIITCYYGKFPNWMQLWLDSCGWNPSIDFFVVTDINMSKYKIAENVHVIKEDMDALRKRFSRACGQECVLTKPYKICDYKVLFGAAFEDILKGFAFWGHCDIDLIFGSLRKFITENMPKQYDRIYEVAASAKS